MLLDEIEPGAGSVVEKAGRHHGLAFSCGLDILFLILVGAAWSLRPPYRRVPVSVAVLLDTKILFHRTIDRSIACFVRDEGILSLTSILLPSS